MRNFALVRSCLPLLCVSLLCVSLPAAPLPRFEAESLTGRKITLPAATAGRSVVLLVGFTQASSKHTAEWAKKTKPICETWSMAVLEDVPRLVRGIASHGIKSGIPKEDQEHFLLLYQHETELKQAAGFQQPEHAYVLLVAPDGSIKWRFHGPVSEDALTELRKQLQ